MPKFEEHKLDHNDENVVFQTIVFTRTS